MWVLTESGELVNLDLFDRVRVIRHESGDRWGVVARRYNNLRKTSEIGQSVLCETDSEEHGKRVIRKIAQGILAGQTVGTIAETVELTRGDRNA